MLKKILCLMSFLTLILTVNTANAEETFIREDLIPAYNTDINKNSIPPQTPCEQLIKNPQTAPDIDNNEVPCSKACPVLNKENNTDADECMSIKMLKEFYHNANSNLKLNQEQLDKVNVLIENAAESIKNNPENTEKIIADTEKEYKTILNAEQKKQFSVFKKSIKKSKVKCHNRTEKKPWHNCSEE